MFQDNIDVKIGRILFENKDSEELYKIAVGLTEVYNQSEKKDKIAGTMAVEVAVASYFEGFAGGASLASYCIENGTGFRGMNSTDLRTIFQVYTEAGAAVNFDCAYIMSKEYAHDNPPYIIANPCISAAWCKKAADAGSVYAQFEMGLRYYQGLGVEINYQQAELYWEAAAKQGHVNAQYNLGCLYSGTLSDGPSMTTFEPEKAGYWLEQAARAGITEAANILNQNFTFNQRKNKWQKKF